MSHLKYFWDLVLALGGSYFEGRHWQEIDPFLIVLVCQSWSDSTSLPGVRTYGPRHPRVDVGTGVPIWLSKGMHPTCKLQVTKGKLIAYSIRLRPVDVRCHIFFSIWKKIWWGRNLWVSRLPQHWIEATTKHPSTYRDIGTGRFVSTKDALKRTWPQQWLLGSQHWCFFPRRLKVWSVV